MTHKLIWEARGKQAWGRCSCGMAAYLTTYVLPSRKVQSVKDQHAKHLDYEQSR